MSARAITKVAAAVAAASFAALGAAGPAQAGQWNGVATQNNRVEFHVIPGA